MTIDESINRKLSIIANLLAIQAIKELDKSESCWILKKCEMTNKEIGAILEISNDAVAAHISNKKKLTKKIPQRRK